MSDWVAIAADESEEPVEIPAEEDGKFFHFIFIYKIVCWISLWENKRRKKKPEAYETYMYRGKFWMSNPLWIDWYWRILSISGTVNLASITAQFPGATGL